MSANPRPSGGRITNVRRTSAKQRRHQHLLETGVRLTEAEKLRRRRLLGFLAKLFIAVVVAAGAFLGGSKLIARVILKNPQYNISGLDVQTDGILDPEEVLEVADLHRGSNIFQADLSKAQTRVASMPQVEKVSILRQLPNRLVIQINERKPVAWIAPPRGGSRDEIVASKQSWLIDANGFVLRPKKLGPQDVYLPIIRGDSDGPFAEGQLVDGDETKAALELLQAEQNSANNTRFQVREIDLSKHFGLVVTDRNGLQVLFDLNEMDRQLKRLDVYLQALDQRGQKPQTINLLVQRNVPVTYMVDAVATDKPVLPPAVAIPSPTPAAIASPAKAVANARAKEKSKNTASEEANLHESAHPKASAPHKQQPFLDPAVNVRKALPVDAAH